MALVVAAEGLPGCGKTTIINLMTVDLLQEGLRVKTIDIDTVSNSTEFRRIAKIYPMGHPIRNMLLWALRIQQHDAIVACGDGADVIFADRFLGAPWAMDAYGNVVPREVLDWVFRGIKRLPDITFLFEAPLEVIRQRKPSPTTEDPAFVRCVERGYGELADSLGWTRVNATRSPEEINTDCLRVILAALERPKS